MTVRLLLIPVGELESEVSDSFQAETHVRTVSTRATSTGLFGVVYRIRDTMTTHFDVEHGTTLGSEIVENYNDFHNRETITLHGTTALVHREFKGTVRERQETIVPGSRDLLAAVFALRDESWKTEGEVHVPVFSGLKQWELVAQVTGRERVTVEAGTFDAVRLRCHTTFGGKLRTNGDIIMWLSDDERRLPLRVSAPLVLGSIDTELTSFEWTPEKADARQTQAALGNAGSR